MTIKKCDRCGRIIEETPKSFLDELSQGVNELLGRTSPSYMLVEKDSNLSALDLCENCETSLRKWVKEGVTHIDGQ